MLQYKLYTHVQVCIDCENKLHGPHENACTTHRAGKAVGVIDRKH